MTEREEAQSLVVIGNGMVSWKLCQKLVEHNAHEELRIVIFGEEPRPAYDRVHLTDLLAGESDENLYLSPEEWYSENGIELYLNDPVVHVDRERSLVLSASGLEVPYNRLVFATGSYPFVPPIEGVDLPGVFVYRTIDDVFAIEDYSATATQAAVIGGGLLGLEAAKAVQDLGLSVHVLEHGAGPMHRQLDLKASELLKEKIEELGVKIYVNAQVTQITQGDEHVGEDRLVLHMTDGKKLIVDMVIISAGIRPRGELAMACGLTCTPNGGIVVDDTLETSDPQIYAIGECASHRGKTYGLVLPGYQMVDVLITNLLGGYATFEGGDTSTKLKLMGITVAALGEHDGDKQALTSALRYTTGGVYRKLVTRSGRLIGAVTVGDWENLDRIRDILASPQPMSFFDMRRFRSTGNLWPKSESQKVSDWAEDAIVCGCLKVTRGTLSLAVVQGCSTVQELSRRTGASSMCGSCRPLLEDLLGIDEKAHLPISMHMGEVSVRDRDRAPLSRRDGAPRSRRSVPPPAISRSPMDLGPLSTPRAFGQRSSVVYFSDPSAQGGESDSGPVSVRRPMPSQMRGTMDSEIGPRTVRSSFQPPAPADSEPVPTGRKSNPDVLSELEMPPPSGQMASTAATLGAIAIVGTEGSAIAETHPTAPSAAHDSSPPDRSSSIPPDRESGSFEPAPMSRRSWVPPRRASLPPPPPKPAARAATVMVERGLTPLFVASVFAVVLALVELVPGLVGQSKWLATKVPWLARALRPPVADTMQDVWSWRIERIMNDNLFRQVSGYVLLGLCLLTLILSLRKRIKRFTFSDMPIFRMVHGLIGMLTLVALILHTGFRMGSHMMLVLSLDFLAVTILGAVAGAITALSAGWPPVTMRDHRLRWYRIHLLVCWPLPILVLLHVLQVYFY